ncbi:MAG: DUF3791 domain-containing protein [Treponema sp.]|nr:DUF3791 domain-containing protein [Treponema sp.]
MDNETKFLVHCIEIYKTARKLNGREVIKLFNQYEIPQYIVACYDSLHTTGPQYIIADIDEFISYRKEDSIQ